MENARISAFFPAYNDEHTIAGLVRTVHETLSSITDAFEIIVVNDGSEDNTGQVLDGLKGEIEQLEVIHHPVNQGYGAALRKGFASCANPLIFYTDGDGQYDPGDLPTLLSQMKSGVDVVNGYKRSRSDPMVRIIMGRTYNLLVKKMFSLQVLDVNCDYRLIRKSVMDEIDLGSVGGGICLELMKKIEAGGHTVVNVPVPHYPRRYGRSQFFKPRKLFRLATELGKLWYTLVVKPSLNR